MHKVALKTAKLIHIKQFKIPDTQHKGVEWHVLERLKFGVIQPAHRCYNNPIFAVIKKDGNVHLVQDFRVLDFRVLNNQSYTYKYLMKDGSMCTIEIGHSSSTIVSTINIMAGSGRLYST